MGVGTAIWFVAIGAGPASLAGYFIAGGKLEGALIGAFVGMIGISAWEFYQQGMSAQNYENWPPRNKHGSQSFGWWAAVMAGILAILAAIVVWFIGDFFN